MARRHDSSHTFSPSPALTMDLSIDPPLLNMNIAEDEVSTRIKSSKISLLQSKLLTPPMEVEDVEKVQILERAKRHCVERSLASPSPTPANPETEIATQGEDRISAGQEDDDGGPIDKSVLISFKYHISYAIWNRKKPEQSATLYLFCQAKQSIANTTVVLHNDNVMSVSVKQGSILEASFPNKSYFSEPQYNSGKRLRLPLCIRRVPNIEYTETELRMYRWKPQQLGGDTVVALISLKEKLVDFFAIDVSSSIHALELERSLTKRKQVFEAGDISVGM
ncbi:hypothetical protein LguiA_021233 [Lonicera macranthoides]